MDEDDTPSSEPDEDASKYHHIHTEPERFGLLIQAALRWLLDDPDRWAALLAWVKQTQMDAGMSEESASQLIDVDIMEAEGWFSHDVNLMMMGVQLDAVIRATYEAHYQTLYGMAGIPDGSRTNPFEGFMSVFGGPATDVEDDGVDTETNGPVE